MTNSNKSNSNFQHRRWQIVAPIFCLKTIWTIPNFNYFKIIKLIQKTAFRILRKAVLFLEYCKDYFCFAKNLGATEHTATAATAVISSSGSI